MHYTLLKKMSVFLFLSLLISSCKKKESISLPKKTRTQLITERDWKLTEVRTRFEEAPWSDLMLGTPDCQLDNREVFRIDKTHEVNEGPSKCNDADPQIVSLGTWDILDNETSLMYLGIKFRIEDLTTEKMILTWVQITPSFSLAYTTTLVFRH